MNAVSSGARASPMQLGRAHPRRAPRRGRRSRGSRRRARRRSAGRGSDRAVSSDSGWAGIGHVLRAVFARRRRRGRDHSTCARYLFVTILIRPGPSSRVLAMPSEPAALACRARRGRRPRRRAVRAGPPGGSRRRRARSRARRSRPAAAATFPAAEPYEMARLAPEGGSRLARKRMRPHPKHSAATRSPSEIARVVDRHVPQPQRDRGEEHPGDRDHARATPPSSVATQKNRMRMTHRPRRRRRRTPMRRAAEPRRRSPPRPATRDVDADATGRGSRYRGFASTSRTAVRIAAGVGCPVLRLSPTPDQATRAEVSSLSSVSPATTIGTPCRIAS